ncbi:MAG: hypothetical protein RLN62_05390 [Rickettsiales bacterium]
MPNRTKEERQKLIETIRRGFPSALVRVPSVETDNGNGEGGETPVIARGVAEGIAEYVLAEPPVAVAAPAPFDQAAVTRTREEQRENMARAFPIMGGLLRAPSMEPEEAPAADEGAKTPHVALNVARASGALDDSDQESNETGEIQGARRETAGSSRSLEMDDAIAEEAPLSYAEMALRAAEAERVKAEERAEAAEKAQLEKEEAEHQAKLDAEHDAEIEAELQAQRDADEDFRDAEEAEETEYQAQLEAEALAYNQFLDEQYRDQLDIDAANEDDLHTFFEQPAAEGDEVEEEFPEEHVEDEMGVPYDEFAGADHDLNPLAPFAAFGMLLLAGALTEGSF